MKRRLETPRFLADLLADLRDRHLIVPIVALLAALAAVPFLLGGSTSEPSGALTAPPGFDDGGAATPAVVLDDPSIRDYRGRLEALTKKNPFDQKFELEEADGTVSVDGGSGSPTSDPSISLESTEPVAAAPEAGSAPPTGSAAVSSSAPSEPAPAASSQPAEIVKETKVQTLVTYRVDLGIGPVGDLSKEKDIGRFAPLPSRRQAIVIFAGTSDNGKRAAFLVSRDVTETHGDGRCVRSGDRCELLFMKPGDTRDFRLEPDDDPIRLRLDAIDKHSKRVDG